MDILGSFYQNLKLDVRECILGLGFSLEPIVHMLYLLPRTHLKRWNLVTHTKVVGLHMLNLSSQVRIESEHFEISPKFHQNVPFMQLWGPLAKNLSFLADFFFAQNWSTPP